GVVGPRTPRGTIHAAERDALGGRNDGRLGACRDDLARLDRLRQELPLGRREPAQGAPRRRALRGEPRPRHFAAGGAPLPRGARHAPRRGARLERLSLPAGPGRHPRTGGGAGAAVEASVGRAPAARPGALSSLSARLIHDDTPPRPAPLARRSPPHTP